MSRKRYTAEQIIGHLRQAEIPIGFSALRAEVRSFSGKCAEDD
jgi:hypothetical protein